MKKKKLVIFIASLLFLSLMINAKMIVKFGLVITHGDVKESTFNFLSRELKLEQMLYENFGRGIGFKEKSQFGHNGYFISFYYIYKQRLLKNWFVTSNLGVEYGIANSKYDYYRAFYDNCGKLIAQKWIYLVQNASFKTVLKKREKMAVIYPFWALACGVNIWKELFIEVGLKAQAMKFRIRSCKFNPINWLAYDVQKDERWAIVSSIFFQIGYKF